MELFKILFDRFKIYITNSAWVFSGLVLRTLIVIFIVSRIANILGISDFGWYNLAISIFTLVYAVSTLGFGDSFLIKFFVTGKYSPEEILGTSLIGRILASLIILGLIAIWIVIATDDHNYWVLFIASISILFQSSEVIGIYYQWKFKARVYVPITVISLILSAILLIYGIINNCGLFFFVTVYTLERVFSFFGLLWTINKEIPIKTFKFNTGFFKLLVIQSWPLLLGAVLTAVYARFDQVLIKYFLTAGDLGIYGTGIILSQIWLVFPGLIIPVLFPKIAEVRLNINKTKYNNIIFFIYGILNYVAIGVIVFIFILGKPIIETLYGPEYSDSVFILKLLILNLIILFQSQLTSNILILEDEEIYLFKIKLVSVISNIALNVILLSTLGVSFAAYSLLISSALSWFLMAFFNKKMLELLKLNFKSFLLPFYLIKRLK